MKNLSADRKSVLNLIRYSYRHLGELYETSRIYQNPELLVRKTKELFDDIKDGPKGGNRPIPFLDDHLQNAVSLLALPPSCLTEKDICLFCYLVIGLNATQICELMHIEKIGTYYSRKSRLKRKIARLGPAKARRYLELLE